MREYFGEGDRAEGMDWLRATLQGDKLYLDGSTDGVVWEKFCWCWRMLPLLSVTPVSAGTQS